MKVCVLTLYEAGECCAKSMGSDVGSVITCWVSVLGQIT